MRGVIFSSLLLGLLLGLIILGGGVLVWLAPVPAEQLPPAQNDLRDLADTVIKGSFGAIIGFVVSLLHRQSNGFRLN